MADTILAQSGIYSITNIANGKSYVGSSVNIKKRWACHVSGLTKGRNRSVRLQNAWNKYGADAFKFSVLEFVIDCSELTAREQFWIDSLGCSGVNGYNARKTADSNLGAKWTEESKIRLSAAKVGKESTAKAIAMANASRIANIAANKAAGVTHYNAGRTKTKEQLLAQGDAQRKANAARESAGIPNPCKGRVTSQETKDRISAAGKGRVVSAETRMKMGAWQVGRKMPESSIEKMRATKNGRKLSPESIAKREATKKANRLAARLSQL